MIFIYNKQTGIVKMRSERDIEFDKEIMESIEINNYDEEKIKNNWNLKVIDGELIYEQKESDRIEIRKQEIQKLKNTILVKDKINKQDIINLLNLI